MTDLVRSGSPFDAIRREDERGEHWSARELMPLLGYVRWESFDDAIKRASISATNSGVAGDHFRDVPKVIEGGRWGTQTVQDYRLTRYAAYLVAMNGDPRKPEIAAAQTYFAVRTREAEVAPARPALPQTYAEALRELAATVEEAERAKAELAKAAPKAQSWDTLASASGTRPSRPASSACSRTSPTRAGSSGPGLTAGGAPTSGRWTPGGCRSCRSTTLTGRPATWCSTRRRSGSRSAACSGCICCLAARRRCACGSSPRCRAAPDEHLSGGTPGAANAQGPRHHTGEACAMPHHDPAAGGAR